MTGDHETRHPSKPRTDSFPFINVTSGLPKEENFRNIQLQTLTQYIYIYTQSGPKKCIHSLLINIFGINLNEISISG